MAGTITICKAKEKPEIHRFSAAHKVKECNLEAKPENLKFIKVEQFFTGYQTWDYISKVISYAYIPEKKLLVLDVVSSTGNNCSICIYIPRKDTFRLRFNPDKSSPDEYSHLNTRTVVMKIHEDTFKIESPLEKNTPDGKLIEVVTKENNNRPYMKIHINMDKYSLKVYQYNSADQEILVHYDAYPSIYYKKVVFAESTRPEYMIIQCKNKPGTAKYVGFGEKGGDTVCKNSTQMNFFNYDNMKYKQVYKIDPDDDDDALSAFDEREPLYHSNPFFVEFYGTSLKESVNGIFVNSPSQVFMDIGYLKSDKYMFGTRFGDMDYYFFLGNRCPDIIEAYTSFVGKSPLHPRYILGYHQGCYGYETRECLEQVANDYRSFNIPIDGLHIDVDIQQDYRTFTIDETKFPKPKDMFTELREKGFKCSTNITPIIKKDPGYTVYKEGLEKGYFVKDLRCEPLNYDGEWYQDYENGREVCYYVKDDNYNSGNPFEGEVFYGGNRGALGHYPDLGRCEVREWWGKQYKYLFEMGLEMVWQDMTTPCIGHSDNTPPHGDMRSFPFKLKITDNFAKAYGQYEKECQDQNMSLVPFIKVINLYSLNLHEATYRGLNNLDIPERKNKRNFIIGRGCYSGMHRYAGLWTGDNASNWQFMQINIAQVLSLGISGEAITGSDIGGFEPYPNNKPHEWADPELFMRWTSMGAFLPWFRNHYNAKEGKKLFQEPYKFISVVDSVPREHRYLYESVLPVCKYYIELRYRLLQLFYDAMFENTLNGMPICRAMFINDGHDAALFNDKMPFLSTQFFVGKDLLIAPVLEKQSPRNWGKRDIYLPAGSNWYCFMNNSKPLSQVVEGGTTIGDFDAHIDSSGGHIGFIVPAYVRAGAIIPTIELEQYVGQLNGKGLDNPITLNIYPGGNGDYTMYLDDGISRSSAPVGDPEHGADEQANNEYWTVRIHHEYNQAKTGKKIEILRTDNSKGNPGVKRFLPHENYLFIAVLQDPEEVVKNIEIHGERINLISGGTTEERAGRLWNSKENAWYLNEDVGIAFIKAIGWEDRKAVNIEYS